MYFLKRWILVIVSSILLLLTNACTKEAKQAVIKEIPKKQIITTIFPIYDFVREIAKDRVEVTLLLPPGVEAHSFEPTPRDIATILESDLFIYTGKYMEPWAHKIVDSLNGKKTQVLDTSKGIELMDEDYHHENHSEGEHEEGHHDHTEGEHEEHTEEHHDHTEEHHDHEEEHHEHAQGDSLEWAGVFELKKGEMKLSFSKKEGKYADDGIKIVLLETSGKDERAIEAVRENALALSKGKAVDKKVQDTSFISPGKLYDLKFDDAMDVSTFKVKVDKDSSYVLFTEHMPNEFEGEEHFFTTISGNPVKAVDMVPKQAHEHSHGEKDPHIWLDPVLAQKMVDNILEYLIKIDASNEGFYLENATNYKSKLAELDKSFARDLKKLKSNKIIYGGHFAFGYFAKRYNLEHISPYEGFAPNAEPTPKRIADLIKNLKESNSTTIFHEENIDPKVAKVISEEAGAKMLLLHGAHNVSKKDVEEGVTYIKIMQENLVNLKLGLGFDE
jgi:ABC-type Zn uptake system ZnuABC Zn-binding protein ZnuA